MSLMMPTQSVNREGKIVEDFPIIIRNGSRQDDVSQFSTGQRETIGLLLTVAVAVWLAERHGGAVEEITLDEFGRNLTMENQELVAGIIGAFSKRLKIRLITPNPAVAMLADGVVNVTLDAMGRTQVEREGE